MDWGSRITYIGSTALKEKTVAFGIKDADRLRHLSVLGASGTGRAELLVKMALQDIERGAGVMLIDASGTAASLLVERLDPALQARIIYLDPSSAEYPYSWNPLDDIRSMSSPERRERLIELLTSIYQIPRGALVDYLADILLERTDASIITFHALATNEKARGIFFEKDEKKRKELEELLKTHASDLSTLEEEGRYVGKDTLVRNLLGQHESKFTLRELFGENAKIIIVDLSHIRIFPTRMTPLVRTFTSTALALAADKRQPFALYLQDCLRYLSEAEIERMFSSHDAAISIADTFVQETDRGKREAAITRCASTISFTAHAADTALVERAFYPYADSDEVSRLGKGEMIVALSIDAVRARPFFAHVLPLPDKKQLSYQDLLVACRKRYATPRTAVDEYYKKLKGNEKDDVPRRKGPGGFQDAFRSIMANRAQQLPTAPSKDAASKTGDAKEVKTGNGGSKNTDAVKNKTNAVGEGKNHEVPEDVLKKMLYVPPLAF